MQSEPLLLTKTKRSGYYRNLGSLRAATRHHGEFLRYGNSFPPTFPEDLLAHASPNDWPIVAKHANTSSRGSINAAPASITSESDTERRLAERAAITAITVMSRSRSQGTEVTIVTGAFPFERSLSSFHGNVIQSRRERGYGQPVPVTQRGRIPINNGARRAGSQLIGGDKPMSAYTSGILNLHIWQVTTWAALRAGQNTSSNSSIIGAIQS